MNEKLNKALKFAYFYGTIDVYLKFQLPQGGFIMKNWNSADKEYYATIVIKFVNIVALAVILCVVAR